jgi:hypothetical protein
LIAFVILSEAKSLCNAASENAWVLHFAQRDKRFALKTKRETVQGRFPL